MKKFLLILLSVLIWGTGAIRSAHIKVGDLYYNYNTSNKTAEVVYEFPQSNNNYNGLGYSLIVPNQIEIGGTNYTVTAISDYAFQQCNKIYSIQLPSRLESIGQEAFANCTELRCLVFPSTLKKIEKNAFYNCSNLQRIEFNGTGARCQIGQNAFFQCNSISSIICNTSEPPIGQYNSFATETIYKADVYYLDTSDYWDYSASKYETVVPWNKFLSKIPFTTGINRTPYTYVFDNERYTAKIIASNNFVPSYSLLYPSTEIPSYVTYNGAQYTVTEIGDEAFRGCTSLSSINIPNTIQKIGKYAFRDCVGLKSIRLPNSLSSLGEGAFGDCLSLVNVSLPTSIEKIPDMAFAHCYMLSSINFPNRLEYIGDYAFFETGLKTVTLSEPLKEIGEYAFCQCQNLTSIITPTTLASMGGYAVYGCNNLTSVTFNASSSLLIGAAAFNKSNNIKEVYCTSTSTPTMENQGVFDLITYQQATLYVTRNCHILPGFNKFWNVEKTEFNDVLEIFDEENNCFTVYNLTGHLIFRNGTKDDLESLSPGVYIINRKKIIIR